MAEQGDVEFEGQILRPRWTYRLINTARIEKGQLIFPIEIRGKKADEHAGLHLILNDLEFSLDCLKEAGSFGTPDANNIVGKALIFSAVVSYARAFDSGTRKIKLLPDLLAEIGAPASRELHDYLYDLRQKHIAHSVNDCERCDTVGVIVTAPDYTRQEDVSGVGVTILTSVGLTKAKLRAAEKHIGVVIEHVRARIEALATEIHNELLDSFNKGEKWTMAPLARFPDPMKVAERRN